MVQPEEEALHADAYIDALLSRSAQPRPLEGALGQPLDSPLQRAIDALARLPRFHPSFAFEESLAARLREAAAGPIGGLAEVIRLPLPARSLPTATAGGSAAVAAPTFGGIDRRLLVGGAIASGVSLAGIAGAIAWRQRAR